jgi:glycosyltransferase involved in cell wall biosynthesis
VKRAVVRSCAGFIAYGSRAREYLCSLGAPPERIAIAPNTVDIAAFERSACSLDRAAEGARLGLEAETPVVLFAGQLIDRKEPLLLIEALATLRREGFPAQLLVVGDGPVRRAVQQRADVGGVRATFAGNVPPAEMARHYVASDVLVLPSSEEIWGLVANEAMACGRTAVLSDACGAAADLVEDGVSGFVFPAGNATALSGVLRPLLRDSARLRGFGEAARERVRLFSLDRAAAGFVEGVRLALERR